MKKVIQFKKVLSSIDLATNILIGLIAVVGLIAMIQTQNIISGIPVIIFAGAFWVLKVLGFGISYTLIQIAENTFDGVVEEEVAPIRESSDLEKDFVKLFDENEDKVTDSDKRAYKKIMEGKKVEPIILKTAIRRLSNA